MPRHVPAGGYPNIQKRIHPLTISYRVRISTKRKRYTITFYEEKEARNWLKIYYEDFRNDPDQFLKKKNPW